VSSVGASMDEKAWLLVLFIPVHGVRVAREMDRVERDARVKDRHVGSVCPLRYAPVRVRAVIFAGV